MHKHRDAHASERLKNAGRLMSASPYIEVQSDGLGLCRGQTHLRPAPDLTSLYGGKLPGSDLPHPLRSHDRFRSGDGQRPHFRRHAAGGAIARAANTLKPSGDEVQPADVRSGHCIPVAESSLRRCRGIMIGWVVHSRSVRKPVKYHRIIWYRCRT